MGAPIFAYLAKNNILKIINEVFQLKNSNQLYEISA